MPAIVDAPIRHESDSEEDLDYVPEGREQDSDTDDERDTKRPRVSTPPLGPEDSAAARSERRALWAKFQDSLNAPPPGLPESEPKRMVKIEKRRRFAGEDVVEVVDVPEDSTDAKKWPLWKPQEGQDKGKAATPMASADSGMSKLPTKDSPPTTPPALPGPSSSSSSSSHPVVATTPPTPQPPTTTTTTTAITAKPRPGRRKPKTQLAELPSSASAPSQSHGKGLKRLTTLEKSALDWKTHVDASEERVPELATELEANRRGGGYLEKVEFLQRVDDRKNLALEANKDHKRRRG